VRIVFFGTPEFAVPSLRALVGEGFDVAAVVTRPDKPRGRSRSHSLPSAVKLAALEEDIQVLQPTRPSEPGFLETFQALEPDIGAVVAYGHLLKPDVLAVPRLGFVNVHPSLLPKLRGAAPIQYAILEGMDETGISIMKMEAGLDSGPVLLRVPTPMATDETYGELSVRLAELGALAMIEGLQLIAMDMAEWEPQNETHATLAPKIIRETARINWNDSAEDTARRVRAMDPAPGAWTQLEGMDVKLFGPSEADLPAGSGAPGEIVETRPAFVVAAGDGALQFLDAQPAGKRRMAATDWVTGRGASAGQRFI
jgi:methionyl-tRNA formyltransferase